MNLLPKKHEEFSQKNYWENFFKKRGNKAFEWYGEYAELCGYFHKYVKMKDNILVVGCGNSSLSSDLYDVGYTNVTSIDISDVVIRQMQNLHKDSRPNLKYIKMDVFEMAFPIESFNVILDKGTLDAIMPNDSVETQEKIKQYFIEVERVLKVGGRYICISLLQKHILKSILNYFPSNSWMFRAIRCFDVEKKADGSDSSLPVFMIICTKFKTLLQQILEVNMSAENIMQRVEKLEDVQHIISGVQQAAFVCSSLKKGNIANQNDISFELYKPSEKNPRFTIYMVDSVPEYKNLQYAAFIVPQGREVEWMFSTSKGRKHLAKTTKYNRLAIITLHRGQEYECLESIQKELHQSVCELAPAGVTGKIPFLSLGSEIGKRIIRCQGTSLVSGEYIVEDIEIDSLNKFRRLFYLNTQSVIQSEAKLKNLKTRKNRAKEIVDHTYLTCKHHTYMSIATQLAASNNSTSSIAIIGLGGGGLCMFLRKFLPNIKITAIDIDKDMLQVAINWFSLQVDNKLQAEIIDGIDFLRNSAEQRQKFDAILFDVDSKDTTIGMSCPPKQFLEDSTLENVKKCLTKKGFLILNLVVRDETLRAPVVSGLIQRFNSTFSYKLEEDLNEILICSIEKIEVNNFRLKAKNAGKQLQDFNKKQGQEDLLEIEEFLSNLHIEDC